MWCCEVEKRQTSEPSYPVQRSQELKTPIKRDTYTWRRDKPLVVLLSVQPDQNCLQVQTGRETQSWIYQMGLQPGTDTDLMVHLWSGIRAAPDLWSNLLCWRSSQQRNWFLQSRQTGGLPSPEQCCKRDRLQKQR